MPLNPDQQRKLSNWFQQKQIRADCPMCGRNNWMPGDITAAPTVDANGNLEMGGQIHPVVQIACANCAYVANFAAVPIGLLS